MADIQTNVPVNISPYINADAESFRAEYDWPGGIPAPSVELNTKNYSNPIDVGTLAINTARQTWQFVQPSADPYIFLILSCGLTVDRGSLSAAQFAAFWESEIGFQAIGSEMGTIRSNTLSAEFSTDPSFLSSRIRSVDFSNLWGGTMLVPGTSFASGPSITATVQTFVSATGMTGYPHLSAIGWPSRVGNLGALRVPGLFLK